MQSLTNTLHIYCITFNTTTNKSNRYDNQSIMTYRQLSLLAQLSPQNTLTHLSYLLHLFSHHPHHKNLSISNLFILVLCVSYYNNKKSDASLHTQVYSYHHTYIASYHYHQMFYRTFKYVHIDYSQLYLHMYYYYQLINHKSKFHLNQTLPTIVFHPFHTRILY